MYCLREQEVLNGNQRNWNPKPITLRSNLVMENGPRDTLIWSRASFITTHLKGKSIIRPFN